MMIMRKAILVIDRGSREPEVLDELETICEMLKKKGQYDLSTYCFLEVIPPFIEEGIRKCLYDKIDYIVVMPYFLYPGMKLKESVKQCAKLCYDMNIRALIAKPLSYHLLLQNLIVKRVNQVKSRMNLTFENKDCHLLVIGHGSSDKSARIAFEYTIDKLLPIFKSVDFCFLELDNPDIQQGVRKVLRRGTGNLIVVPYFLHEGAHVKRDVRVELNSALEKYGKRDIYITTHLGSGEELVEAMVERAREVESKIVL